MADNILLEYMQKRFKNLNESTSIPLSEQKGKPFITISRQYGCPSKEIADHLQQLLYESSNDSGWNVINKEIIEKSAKELDLKPQKLQYVFDAQEKSVMDEVISALSTRYYKSDRKIRKTIREIIENLSSQGHVIIIGRGGVAITNDFPGSFHVRLYATERWRLKEVMKKHPEMSEADAYRKLRYIDKKRTDLINHFSGRKFDFNRFDIQVNCEKFDPEQAAHIIIHAMNIRQTI
jgi:cytidylate kinase